MDLLINLRFAAPEFVDYLVVFYEDQGMELPACFMGFSFKVEEVQKNIAVAPTLQPVNCQFIAIAFVMTFDTFLDSRGQIFFTNRRVWHEAANELEVGHDLYIRVLVR